MAAEFPLPDTEWEMTREFWAAAERGELVIPRCDACGTYNWYPASRCKSCDSEKLVWTPVTGRGRLFSWAVVRHAFLKEFAEKVPYVTGLVVLDEDPSIRLATNLIDYEAEQLKIDMPVRVVFRPLAFPGISREVIAPMFAPVEEPDV